MHKNLALFPFSLLTNYQRLELWIHRTKHWDTNFTLHSYCICWPVRCQLICQLCLKEVAYFLFPPVDWRMLFLRCTLRKALDLFDFCVLFFFGHLVKLEAWLICLEQWRLFHTTTAIRKRWRKWHPLCASHFIHQPAIRLSSCWGSLTLLQGSSDTAFI